MDGQQQRQPDRVCLLCGCPAQLLDQRSGEVYCRPCGGGLLLLPKQAAGVLLVDLMAVDPQD